MLENTERAIKNGQSRELEMHDTQDEEKQNKNTTQYDICVGQHI